MSTIHEKLVAIQSELKAPKGQTNNFGKYKYRSCEDILESVKPLLKEQGLILILSDEVVMIGSRFYVKATAGVHGKEGNMIVTAFAREEESKKGMDGAQITGAASSYARKYALNGLFCIDDTKDADTMDNTKAEAKSAPKVEPKAKPTVTQVMEMLNAVKTAPQLETVWSAAIKYSWTEKEKSDLEQCKENVSSRILMAS